MKRNLLLLSVISVFAMFFSISCSTDSPSESKPAPTPVILAAAAEMEDFEDGSYVFSVNDVTGNITTGDDSTDGGTSEITGSSIVTGQLNGTYSLALTATVKSTLPVSTTEGDYTAMMPPSYDHVGYVTVNINFNNPVDLITNNDFLYFTHKISDATAMAYRIYFYSQDRKYCYVGNNTPSTTSIYRQVYFSLLSSPSEYTAAEVLLNVNKIVFVLKYRSNGISQKDINFHIDDIGVSPE
ncbi:MAG: hypothetical protein JXR81_06325 [Candidatus Goldbacteria bacterium]|nr:hypothetical protein [Candidatus Goldiibacteriota bacterium]